MPVRTANRRAGSRPSRSPLVVRHRGSGQREEQAVDQWCAENDVGRPGRSCSRPDAAFAACGPLLMLTRGVSTRVLERPVVPLGPCPATVSVIVEIVALETSAQTSARWACTSPAVKPFAESEMTSSSTPARRRCPWPDLRFETAVAVAAGMSISNGSTSVNMTSRQHLRGHSRPAASTKTHLATRGLHSPHRKLRRLHLKAVGQVVTDEAVRQRD
jgi:hypothetical protein